MIALLTALLISQSPPGQPGVDSPPRPRVVLVSMEGCIPCKRLWNTSTGKGTLKPVAEDDAIDFQVIDSIVWNRQVQPALRVQVVPVIFVWPNPKQPGVRLPHQRATLDHVRQALRQSDQTCRPSSDPPAVRRAASLPYLSVNGLPERAQHSVTITGDVWLVYPNTEQMWRRHVAEDHGVAGAWKMTPQQLAEAHRDAHRAK